MTATSLLGSGLAIALPAAPAAARNWQEVTCESWNYREASCPAPGAVRVQLLRVRGGNCVEGQSWIHDGRVIRVRNGCRAVFRIDSNNGWGLGGGEWTVGGGNGGVQSLRCESWNYRDQQCPVRGNIGSARITRVIAGDCRDGATWRWDRRAIYVRNGCRADFEVRLGSSGWGGSGGNGGGFGGGGGGGGGGGQAIATINCQSWNYQQARCPIPRARQVRLNRVLAGDCRQGRTWGWEAGFIWVNGGCRAAFDVLGR
ncbi:DUF3011 domain-containing protein [Sandarakinorhabdus sp.]|uniref:DUF3011 domain-containing protein n=1 Tax=Sandarakinorhabdus sp. TaxID=1916663 RepID=UPI003F70C384